MTEVLEENGFEWVQDEDDQCFTGDKYKMVL